MSKTKAGPIHADRLKSFFERIEKLKEELKAIQGDIRDVFAEAKGVGYDVKTMRKVLALRAMDAADRAEQETLIDVYMHALGMIDRVEARVASGESIRKAAKAEGMPKSTAIRQVTQNRRNEGNGSEVGTGSATVVTASNLDALSPDDDTRRSTRAAPGGDLASPTERDGTENITAEDGGVGTGTDIFAESANSESCGGQDAVQHSQGGPTSARIEGGGDDRRLLSDEPEVARVAPPATPPISDAQALANLEEVEAAYFLRRDSTRVVASPHQTIASEA